MNIQFRQRPGRPKAIPEGLVLRVLEMYRDGLGYRAIARELEKYGVLASFSSVHRVIKDRQGVTSPQIPRRRILKLPAPEKLTETICPGSRRSAKQR